MSNITHTLNGVEATEKDCFRWILRQIKDRGHINTLKSILHGELIAYGGEIDMPFPSFMKNIILTNKELREVGFSFLHNYTNSRFDAVISIVRNELKEGDWKRFLHNVKHHSFAPDFVKDLDPLTILKYNFFKQARRIDIINYSFN